MICCCLPLLKLSYLSHTCFRFCIFVASWCTSTTTTTTTILILLPQEPPPELQACCWRRTTRKKSQRHLLLFILSDGNNTGSRAVRLQAQQETGRVVVVRHGWLASGIQMPAAHMKNALKAWHKTVIIRWTKDVTEEYTPDFLPQAAKKPNKTIKQKQYYKREMKTQLSFQRHMIASGLLLLLHKIRRVQIKNLANVPK